MTEESNEQAQGQAHRPGPRRIVTRFPGSLPDSQPAEASEQVRQAEVIPAPRVVPMYDPDLDLIEMSKKTKGDMGGPCD